jgi:hypothetical protein
VPEFIDPAEGAETVDIARCPSCGRPHPDVVLRRMRLTYDVAVRGLSLTADLWTPCPVTGDPLLYGPPPGAFVRPVTGGPPVRVVDDVEAAGPLPAAPAGTK